MLDRYVKVTGDRSILDRALPLAEVSIPNTSFIFDMLNVI